MRRLQDRICRAAAAGKLGQVKNLQKLLVRSLSAKRLGVRRVTQQKAGRNTPGVDGMVCKTPESRTRLTADLSLKSHRPQPVRRVHVPKSDGRAAPQVLKYPATAACQLGDAPPPWPFKSATPTSRITPARGASD